MDNVRPIRDRGALPCGRSGALRAACACRRHLRLLSYNIQAGMDTRRYTDYLTRGWRHVLPDLRRLRNLDEIAGLVRRFDIVALQEADGGSLRSGFINQIHYLASQAGFPLSYRQTNRRLGKLGQHGNGLLCRFRPTAVVGYRLPAAPGRGALLAQFPAAKGDLVVITAHLSLRRRARLQQLAFLGELCRGHEHVVLMGDLNCLPDSPEMRLLIHHSNLQLPRDRPLTFPSWQPARSLDHVLTTPSLRMGAIRTLQSSCSDHLPLAVDIVLPPGFHLCAVSTAARQGRACHAIGKHGTTTADAAA